MAILKEHWLDWLLAGVLAALLMAAPGCDATLPGFRFAATEEQQQTAQVAADLAAALAPTGAPPGSAALRQAAAGARVASAYAGVPDHPIDIMDLLTPDTTQAWEVKSAQNTALATRDRVQKKLALAVAAAANNIQEAVVDQQKGTVNADAIVPQLDALVTILAVGQELVNEIVVPNSPSLTPEQAQLQSALTALMQGSREKATAQGKRPVKVGEVVNAAVDQGVGVLDELGLTELVGGLLGTAGLGGLAVWLKGRSKIKQAEAVAAAATNGHGNGGAASMADILNVVTAALAATPAVSVPPAGTPTEPQA